MRLIDADIIKLEKGFFERVDNVPKFFEWLGKQPTIDAVEVVRCKDCKHRDPEDRKCDCGHGILWQLPRDGEWFCADGERKGEDDGTD